jgi:hypothetical protein
VSASTRTFTKVATKAKTEVARYEVDNDAGYIGDVFTITPSTASPSKRVWVAELMGDVVGSAKTRYGAARLLGVARPTPFVKVPRKGEPWHDGTLFADDLTFQVVQPVLLFSGAMPSGKGPKPTAKPERRGAAMKVLRDHAAVLDAAGVTAKVGKDGFVHMSPAALERLLNLVTAVRKVTA